MQPRQRQLVLNRIISKAAYPSSDTHHIQYLDMLDFVLDDLELDDDEEDLRTRLQTT